MIVPKWLISHPMVAALLLMAGVAALDLAGLRLTTAAGAGLFSAVGGRLLHRRIIARPRLYRQRV
jgi:hypothetical protein